MESKIVGLLSFISMFLVINCQTAVPLENLSEQEIETAIYYGDSNVNIGDSFKITCIIPISELINWVKDGEPITNHNLRHWRDEHSFITSESAIDEPELLVPNYDNAEHQLKAFDIRTLLVLSCNVTKEGDYDLIWEKNGTEVSKVGSLQGRYRIIKPERKFIIEKPEDSDAGLYSCRVNNEKKDIRVYAKVVVRVPSNTGVVEGEKLSIHCDVVGTDAQLYWQMGNLTIYNTTGKYVLKEDEKHIQNAVLSVENISLDDRGEFKCLGRNIVTDLNLAPPAEHISYVRIKGKLAALWPFLGICAEVLILCTIILIYEKRRNKTELEESDTDPNTEQ